MGACVRVNKVLGVVNHEVYVADTVQVEVWRKLRRLLLFQARRTSVLVQSPRFLLSCSVRGMPELVQCLSRPYRKPTCLDRPARGCTYVCGQTWTRRSRSFFLGRPTSGCHVEFSKSRCLGASEVPWWPCEVTIRSVAILFYSTRQSTTGRWCRASATMGFLNIRKKIQLWKEKRRQSQQPPVNSLQVRRSTI